MASRPAWSFAYRGAQNCTQNLSLSTMRVKERGIITFPGLWAVFLLRPPRMFFLPELFANVIKIFYLMDTMRIWTLWIAEPIGMFDFLKLFSSRHFIYMRKIKPTWEKIAKLAGTIHNQANWIQLLFNCVLTMLSKIKLLNKMKVHVLKTDWKQKQL